MPTTERTTETTTPSYPMARGCPFDPPAELDRLRDEEPVRRVEHWDGTRPWLVTRYDDVRAVLMHELGHVVGLDHVDDPTALMHATNTGQTGFGPGDLAGLARLGEGECEPGL